MAWGNVWGLELCTSKLTPTAIKSKLRAPERYGDSKGLYLEVGASGSASWIVRVQKNGKRRDIGLGEFDKVPLTRARQLAAGSGA